MRSGISHSSASRSCSERDSRSALNRLSILPHAGLVGQISARWQPESEVIQPTKSSGSSRASRTRRTETAPGSSARVYPPPRPCRASTNLIASIGEGSSPQTAQAERTSPQSLQPRAAPPLGFLQARGRRSGRSSPSSSGAHPPPAHRAAFSFSRNAW